MTNTNIFKPGDRVKYMLHEAQGAIKNGHIPGRIYVVERHIKNMVKFEDEPWCCADHRLELVDSQPVTTTKINIETMKKESLDKIQALVESEVKKFTDIGLNAEFIMRFSNRSNNNITSLDLSA